MANWSLISINFTSDLSKLEITEDVISSELEIDVNQFLITEDEKTFVSASAKWSTNMLKISEFANKYSLSFIFEESEPGYDYYTLYVFENGIEIDFVQTEYFSVESLEYHGLDYFIKNLFYDDDVNRDIYKVLEEVGELDDEIKKKAIKILMEAKDES